MNLIQVLEYGYGLDGRTLDLTIALPKGAYLNSFWVATQEDIFKSNSNESGIEYITGITNALNCRSEKEAFDKLFDKAIVPFEINGIEYYSYKLKSDILWSYDNKHGASIKIDRKDLIYLTLKVVLDPDYKFDYPTECGEDSTTLVFPIYNICKVKLDALDYVDFTDNCGNVPNVFIDKILQSKAIELAIACGDYCKASYFWRKFYNTEKNTHTKKCKCHG